MNDLRDYVPIANASEPLKAVWESSIWTPVSDILSRPCKNIRGSLTHLGYGFIRPTASAEERQDMQPILNACSELVELLHAGSLVVDDIQDNSEVRRGSPTLHRIVGMPLALNAGNWMYFYAFEPIKKLQLSADLKAKIYEEVQETLLAAHFGQAIDIAVRIDEIPVDRIPEVVRSSLELKSGALMALALVLGAHVAGATAEQVRVIKNFGLELGVILQMFDDLGNLAPEKPTAKHLEDLTNRRPSYVWSFLAQPENQKLLPEFRKAIQQLPDMTALKQFVNATGFKTQAKKQAWQHFETVLQQLEKQLQSLNSTPTDYQPTLLQIKQVGERIANAY